MRGTLLSVVLLLLTACSVAAGTVRVTVEEPSGVARKSWPVTSGVPLAKGALPEGRAVGLFSADGEQVPLQTEVLARWPDGSARWLLLDFQVDLAAGQKKVFSLRHGEGVKPSAVDDPVTVRREDGSVTVETGAMRVRFSGRGFAPLGEVWLDGDADGRFAAAEQVLGPVGLEVPGSGEASPPEEIVLEQSGPIRACVRFSGRHGVGDGRSFRYVGRLHVFRGRPFVKLHYTFVNDRPNSLMTKIPHLSLPFCLAGSSGNAKHCVLEGKQSSPSALRVNQVDEAHYSLDGKLPDSDLLDGRAAGWAAIGSEASGFAVGLREFWQHWPKSIDVIPSAEGSLAGAIRMGICPKITHPLYEGKPLDEENKLYYQLQGRGHTFKVGVAKTHELWGTVFSGKPDVAELARFFQAAEDPLLATCEPAHVSQTGAAGQFPPADRQRYLGYDAWFDRALEANLKRRDKVREYGMLNYGDWYGERQVNWGNLEYDLAHGMFLQYLRTGDRRFFLRGEQAARHHIDVDVVHAVNEHVKNPWGAPPRVGDIWLHCLNHTGGYYQDAPLPVSRTYQMGHSTNFGHVWVSGDLDYYYLTGDRRALDVSITIADAMASHMPNRYGTHIRTLGWPTILVLAAYEATGDRTYLDAATKNWKVLKENIDWERGWLVSLANDHCLHPEGSTHEERATKYRDQRCVGNVPFMEGLMLCGLARYHRVTGDPEVLRAISVGIDQMIRECWQEDVKTFRYTACSLSSKAPYSLFLLSAEAMSYEVAQTGNREHLRILREGVKAAVSQSGGMDVGKGVAQMIFFAPHGLTALED